jgi:hypothetical protein
MVNLNINCWHVTSHSPAEFHLLLLTRSLTHDLEAVFSFEILVNFHRTIWNYIPSISDLKYIYFLSLYIYFSFPLSFSYMNIGIWQLIFSKKLSLWGRKSIELCSVSGERLLVGYHYMTYALLRSRQYSYTF